MTGTHNTSVQTEDGRKQTEVEQLRSRLAAVVRGSKIPRYADTFSAMGGIFHWCQEAWDRPHLPGEAGPTREEVGHIPTNQPNNLQTNQPAN